MVVVDKATGALATDATQPENREQKVVEVYPAEWAAWARQAGRPEAPRAPATPTPGPAQSPPQASRDGNSTLEVSGPTAGAAVRGQVDLRGTVSGKAFASYRVEYGEGMAPSAWKPVGETRFSPVENGVLERWDAGSLNGPYRLRVTLTERQAPPAPTPPSATPATATPGAPHPPAPAPPTSKVVEIPVVVDNQPPTASLTAPAPGATLKKSEMERLTLNAQVYDNHRIARTDFYVDGQLVGSSTTAPASFQWPMVAGQHTLRAVARDAAGNETATPDVKITVQ
jgi:hypothetical protein